MEDMSGMDGPLDDALNKGAAIIPTTYLSTSTSKDVVILGLLAMAILIGYQMGKK